MDDVKKYIEKKCREIWQVPKETNFNSITTSRELFFRPNNYRRQIKVKTKSKCTIKKIISTIRGVNFNKHTKLLSIKNYKENITLQYGKNKLTAIYSQPIVNNVKTVYLIKRDSFKEIQDKITEIKEEIKQRLDKALIGFARKFNIKLPYERIVWTRYEDFMKGEDYIDKIPKDVIIHDTIFKKVYGKGIEFIKHGKEEPIVHYKNYIKNRAIEDIAPKIAEEIGCFKEVVTTYQEQLKGYAVEIKNHRKVQELQIKNQQEMNIVLKKIYKVLAGKPTFLSRGGSLPLQSQSSLLPYC